MLCLFVDSSFEQVSVVMDDDTTTRTQVFRDFYGRDFKNSK